jgi:hypothetical protein
MGAEPALALTGRPTKREGRELRRWQQGGEGDVWVPGGQGGDW